MPGGRGKDELTMVGFLWRNLKGYRFRVFIAIVMAFAQVNAAIFNAFPLKWILDKIAPPLVNGKPMPSDPNISYSDGIITFFDNLGGATVQVGKPHSTVGVILFSVSLIVVLGIINAILSYIELRMAS